MRRPGSDLAAVTAVALTVLACRGSSPAASADVAAPLRSTASTATAAVPPSTPAPSLASSPPVAELLPHELGGVELHTFAVGQDVTARMAAALGVAASDMEIAYASEHGARFLQIYAMRAPGVDGASLRQAFIASAYDAAEGQVTEITEDRGGRSVSVVEQPATVARLGTFYAYVRGDVLFVVQALDADVAAEALAALP